MGVGKYIKTAFVNHWNLLALFSGLGFAFLSPAPDVAAALVLAAEIGYLGLLGTHPKFQKYVDAQAAKSARAEEADSAEKALRRILHSLPKESLKRYEALKDRCVELRQIANDLRHPGGAAEPVPLDSLQLDGLDRLLWIYLRLLFSEHSLSRFLETTDEKKLRLEIDRVEGRLRQAEATPAGPRRERILHSLRDNLQTCQERLANYQKAVQNYQLVQLEIERLENKIRSLSELAINRHEPDYISGQVDQVADSMKDTERTINELQFVTGLTGAGDEVPELVRRQSVTARR